MRWTLWVIALTGCYDGFLSEENQLRLTPDDVVTEPWAGFYPDNPVLQGAEVCASVACGQDATCPGDLAVALCFEDVGSGAIATSGPACVEAIDVGAGLWSWDPIPCAANDAGYAPVADRVALTVVDPAEVEARLEQWIEAAVEVPGSARGPFPKDWTVPEGGLFRIVEGGHLMLPVVLRHPDFEGSVAWNDARGEVSAIPNKGAGAAIERPGEGWVVLTAPVGSESEIRFSHSGQEWSLGAVAGVPDAPDSIELVVALDVDTGEPFGARAVVRDASGALVYGTPIHWTVLEGELAVEPGGDLPGQDYAVLEDACVAPEDRGGPRTVVLEAAHGGVSDQIALEWNGRAGDPDDLWLPSEQCQYASKGCGCRSAPLQASWMAIGLVALGFRRRRPSAA